MNRRLLSNENLGGGGEGGGRGGIVNSQTGSPASCSGGKLRTAPLSGRTVDTHRKLKLAYLVYELLPSLDVSPCPEQ